MQVLLHDVDKTKADVKNLTVDVLEVMQKKDNSCLIYHLACKAVN